jgi:alpha-tubulin suppressor-like RCC1 family protein
MRRTWSLTGWGRWAVVVVAGCGGENAPTQPPVPAKLGFLVQPSTAMAGGAITPAVRVAIQDASGNTVTTATTSIVVAIGTNTGATLAGTTTVGAVNGVATFSDLSIDKSAMGYALTASATGLAGATSGGFNITAGAPAKLRFTLQPTRGTAGVPIPEFQVGIQDPFGNPVTTATNAVTAAIGNNPGGGTLTGTITVTAVNGLARFSDLSIDKGGTGYTLTASAAGLTGATSTGFDLRVPLTSALTAIATGGAGQGSHTCGVTTDGAVYCWGFNGRGQLGDNSGTDQYAPVLVQAPSGVTFQRVSAGGQHTCAVTVAGDVYCWGRNEFGRLGDGTATDRRAPVRVAAPVGVTFASVSAGAGHSCGLAAAGGVAYCWGTNSSGQLGDGSATNNMQLTPTLVRAPAGVTFTAVTTGFFHSCGLATSGDVYCWGANFNGQLGDNTTTDKPTPVRAIAPAGVTFAQVDAGYVHTCALTPSGNAYCWGYNADGELGDNTKVDKLVPTAVQVGLFQFAIVSAGGNHTCGVTTTGFGYCWGSNSTGQIGDNTTLGRLIPAATAGGLSLSVVAAGLFHSCAIATGANAGVYCWGNNGQGQLGDGTTAQRLVPTRVQ